MITCSEPRQWIMNSVPEAPNIKTKAPAGLADGCIESKTAGLPEQTEHNTRVPVPEVAADTTTPTHLVAIQCRAIYPMHFSRTIRNKQSTTPEYQYQR